jgi:hypothetical protein
VAQYNPRAIGMAERAVGKVKLALMKKLEGHYDRWDDALVGITHAINIAECKHHQSSPFALFFGRAANTWSDYRLADLQAQIVVPTADEIKAYQELVGQQLSELQMRNKTCGTQS